MLLYEEIFLLSISEEKGRIKGKIEMQIRYLLSGAVLAELALAERIALDGKHHLVVLNQEPTGEILLDESLVLLAESGHARKPSYWVRMLADRLKRLEHRVGLKLVDGGILKREEKRYLWVIPYEAFPEQDASAKYWLKQRLRAAVLTSAAADRRTVTLLSFLRACDLLDLIFTRDEVKLARKTIDLLVQGDEFGRSVREAVEEINAAAAAASLDVFG